MGKETKVWWKRTKFKFLNGDEMVGYTKLDEIKSTTEGVNETQLKIEVGSEYEDTFKEVKWSTGFDLLSMMGLMGGTSFLLLIIHTVFFIPLKTLYTLTEHEAEGYQEISDSSSIPQPTPLPPQYLEPHSSILTSPKRRKHKKRSKEEKGKEVKEEQELTEIRMSSGSSSSSESSDSQLLSDSDSPV
eukprot:CAMPEP_0174262250 /NCGR_PEP_ID=MMETSP0439-20130205/12868_1 /TAXON_ID=0 /ORGANISM="Stereomyxa ramosa, Strain Chinc5" /LENGTH=186 /DNA_ID=CAMNT_0015346939 /DNA_START=558 /DNA_END=1118 /DNA_ORIENTATION=-